MLLHLLRHQTLSQNSIESIMEIFISAISGKEFPENEKILPEEIRTSLRGFIEEDNPGFDANGAISISELNYYREKYITDHLLKEMKEISDVEKNVVNALTKRTTISNIPDDDNAKLTYGQRLADKVADFGGSWTFIISFVVFLLLWIGFNIWFLNDKGFDPYPFILLNLILSCIAALQAPVIMMSQNRQEQKDRQRAKMDYMVNLKSELEIRILHEKIDHLIMHQQEHLLDLQKQQLDKMDEILNKQKG